MKMKPVHTMTLLFLIFLISITIMYFFPKQGISITNGFSISYPSPGELLSALSTKKKEKKTIEKILEEAEPIPMDSIFIKDSVRRAGKEQKNALRRIQYADEARSALHTFFSSLKNISTHRKIRVIHYGDSQIEGDRITGFFRNELQKRFGGTGPGLISVKPIARTLSVTVKYSKNWRRITVFGRPNANLNHNKFGLMASFSRFGPFYNSFYATKSDTANDTSPVISMSTVKDSLQVPEKKHKSDTLKAWIEIFPSTKSYHRIRKYSEGHILLGNNHEPVRIKTFVGDSVIDKHILSVSDVSKRVSYYFKKTPRKIRIEFEGFDSPDIYGLSLEGDKGIIVDNVSMRGSSGTIFKKIHQKTLSQQYMGENIRLIVLQYGGNSVPYIKSDEHSRRFGRSFQSNLKKVKSMVPDASFLVIGPSDMSTKLGSEFVTFPYLESVRDAMKQAAFSEGAAYWDLYEVMGGKNSMPLWVDADPPLAGKDYVHFTWKGSRKISELLYKAVINDYTDYLNDSILSDEK